MLILFIVDAGNQVRLIKHHSSGQVCFRAAEELTESSEEEEVEADHELEEWLGCEQDRRESFERKMNRATSRDSIIERGGEWLVAGQMTQQFYSEITDYLAEDDDSQDQGDD